MPATRLAIWFTSLTFLALLIFLGFSAWLDVGSFHALAGDDVRSFTYARESFTAYNDFFRELLNFTTNCWTT